MPDYHDFEKANRWGFRKRRYYIQEPVGVNDKECVIWQGNTGLNEQISYIVKQVMKGNIYIKNPQSLKNWFGGNRF